MRLEGGACAEARWWDIKEICGEEARPLNPHLVVMVREFIGGVKRARRERAGRKNRLFLS